MDQCDSSANLNLGKAARDGPIGSMVYFKSSPSCVFPQYTRRYAVLFSSVNRNTRRLATIYMFVTDE